MFRKHECYEDKYLGRVDNWVRLQCTLFGYNGVGFRKKCSTYLLDTPARFLLILLVSLKNRAFRFAPNCQHVLLILTLCLCLASCQVGVLPGGWGDGLPATTLAASPGTSKAFVNWGAIDGAEGYRLYWVGPYDVSEAGSISITPSDTNTIDIGSGTINFEHDGLINGRLYCYIVVGMLSGNPQQPSVIDCAVPMAAPPVTTAASSMMVAVSWEAVEGAKKYIVYRGIATSSPSVSKAAGASVACVSSTESVYVGETTDLTINDDDGGAGLSNCIDYCYTVVPVSYDDKEMDDSTQWVLAQPSTRGELDASFGTDGVLIDPIDDGGFADVAVSSDDSIVGIINRNDDGSIEIVKYSSDGKTIVWRTNIPPQGYEVNAYGITLDGSGNIYLAGRAIGPNPDYVRTMIACKITSDGVLDASFGTGGCYYHQAIDTEGNAVAVESSGNVLVAGDVLSGLARNQYLTVWQFDASGRLNEGFADNGAFTFTEANSGANAVRVISDSVAGNRIVVAGSIIDPRIIAVFPTRLLVVTLDGSGNLLGSVGNETGAGAAYGVSASIAENGGLVIAGTSNEKSGGWYNGPEHIYQWEYRSVNDLTLVTVQSYKRTLSVRGTDGFVDCRDRPIAGGYEYYGELRTSVTIRTDGSLLLDSAFGNSDPVDGWFAFADSPGEYCLSKIVEDSMGRLIVAGYQLTGLVATNPMVQRLK